jgi:hypothetical protein
MAMQMGLNGGHGSCMKCKVFLYLMIVPDLTGDVMEAVLWDDYMKKIEVT